MNAYWAPVIISKNVKYPIRVERKVYMTILLDINDSVIIVRGEQEIEFLVQTCDGESAGLIVASSMLTMKANMVALTNAATKLPSDFFCRSNAREAIEKIMGEHLSVVRRIMDLTRLNNGIEPFLNLDEPDELSGRL